MLLLFIFSFFILSLQSSCSIVNRFRRQANGCGPMTLNIDEFLQNIGEDVLIGCCNEHDLCYDTCGKTQFICDTTFLNCMTEACKNLSLSSDISRCQGDARILFWLVFFGGQPSYEQAQQQHNCTISKKITNNILIETIKQQ